MTLFYILLATFTISLLSFVGILATLFKEQKPGRGLLILVALSTGAMLGNALFHLLPEAIEEGAVAGIPMFHTMLVLTGAFVLSFVFEQLFSWHHCHSTSHHGDKSAAIHCETDVKPFAHLVLMSDLVHNFIDGLIIAAAFVVSPALGIATTIAIALHEIPQEFGDFAVLVYGGFSRKRALFLNFLSATTAIAGGAVGYFLSSSISNATVFLLPFAAGSFLYVAASDLLPELKHDEKATETVLHFSIFIFGLLLMIGFALNE